ncbi:MAG: hypothetical protein AMJ79_08700 [Phycisphaerae bacterium SM23_30]|nr:MAG: hypothetical protein AMJ79_08700 [Phycisphaerae bacterium SM23_30]
MLVGTLQMQVGVFDAMTLKDKRRVIKSIKDRISNKYNVSIAEVGDADQLRSSILGVAMVGNDRRFLDSALSGIVEYVKKAPKLSLIDYTLETG